MKISIRRMFLITFLCGLAFFILGRPCVELLKLFGSNDSYLYALYMPFQHWAWLLGFDVKYSDPHGMPVGAFLIGIASMGVSVTIHFIGSIVFFNYIRKLWAKTAVEVKE